MPRSSVTLVAGSPGVGKTTWIQQQLQTTQNGVYLRLGAESLPIDDTRVAANDWGERPPSPLPLTVASPDQMDSLLVDRPDAPVIYIELDFSLDPATVQLPIASREYQRVALVSPGADPTLWRPWAGTLIPGAPSHAKTTPSAQACLQVWRSPLTGQIFDPASIDTFWYELTHAAYGSVQRAKGIFDLADGRACYADFVAGLPPASLQELDLPLWYEGRPTRFSGIEICGAQLAQPEIAQTLKDCGLDDAAIAHYQTQIRAALGVEAP
jgi:hypothetical protein